MDRLFSGQSVFASRLKAGTEVFDRLLRSARWRREPASDNQKKFIATRWSKAPKAFGSPDETSQERVKNLSKGEAANIISRLKHGAMVRLPLKSLAWAYLRP